MLVIQFDATGSGKGDVFKTIFCIERGFALLPCYAGFKLPPWHCHLACAAKKTFYDIMEIAPKE